MDLYYNNGDADNDWSNPNNWWLEDTFSTPAGVIPTTGDNAFVRGTALNNVPLTIDFNLEFDEASSQIIFQDGVSFATGGFHTHIFTGTCSFIGASVIETGSTFTIDSGAVLDGSNRTCTVQGTFQNDVTMAWDWVVTVSGGTLIIGGPVDLISGGTLEIASGGTLSIINGGTFGVVDTGGFDVNSNSFITIVTGGNLVMADGQVVRVTSGIINMSDGSIGGDGTLRLNGSSATLNQSGGIIGISNWHVIGTPILNITGGSISIITVSGTSGVFIIPAGRTVSVNTLIDSTVTFNINGILTLISGCQSVGNHFVLSGGLLTVNSGATLNASVAAFVTVNLGGTLTVAVGGKLTLGGGGLLTNNGTFNWLGLPRSTPHGVIQPRPPVTVLGGFV